MEKDILKSEIGIPDGKEDFVIEIYTDEIFFGEIERGPNGKLILKIFNKTNQGQWNLCLDNLFEILKKSKFELEK